MPGKHDPGCCYYYKTDSEIMHELMIGSQVSICSCFRKTNSDIIRESQRLAQELLERTCSCHRKTDSQILRELERKARILSSYQKSVSQVITEPDIRTEEEEISSQRDSQMLREQTDSAICTCHTKIDGTSLSCSQIVHTPSPVCSCHLETDSKLFKEFGSSSLEESVAEEYEEGDKLDEKKEWASESKIKADKYLKEHRIHDVFHFLGSHLLTNVPGILLLHTCFIFIYSLLLSREL